MDTKQDMSPIPWQIGASGKLFDATGVMVATPSFENPDDTIGRRIVSAVNSYPALVEALQIAAVIAREQINRAPADSDAEAGAIADHRIIAAALALALADGKAVKA